MGIQYQVFCPVCGLNHHDRVEHDPERPSQIIGRHNFWEDVVDFDPTHPYGVILESQGRGTLRVVRYFAANEDPTGAFPLVKARMLAALQEWITKGYIDKDEAAGAVSLAVQGPPLAPYSPARVVETTLPKPTKTAAPAKAKLPKPRSEKKAPKPKKEELLGPELPKVEKAKPPKKEKKAPPPVEIKPRKKPEFQAPFSMSQLANGKFYYQDSRGKFIPPSRWQEILGIEPGPQALTPEQYEAYRTVLREAEIAAEEARLKLLGEITPGTWVRDVSGRDWIVVSREDPLVRVKSPQGTTARIGIQTIAQTNVPPPAVITTEVKEKPKATRPVVEEEKRPPAGVLSTVIPKGENILTLSQAFKALQNSRYLRREPLTPEQRTVEEEKFRKLLIEEMKSGAILGGAGQAGTLEENKRLKVGNVTGFIRRP